MLTTYFKTSVRFLLKNRFYALINIFGLALGIATFLLIALWVTEEVSYDRFHAKADRIFRVNMSLIYETMSNRNFPRTPLPLGEVMNNTFPEIRNFTQIGIDGKPLITHQENQFYESNMLFVDDSFFEVFDFKLLAGNAKTALDDPYSVLISEKMAEKYFGQKNALNQVIDYKNGVQLTVTGILQNPPSNSHIQYDFIVPFILYEKINPLRYGNTPWNYLVFTYVLLQDDAETSLNTKLPDFTLQTLKPHYGDVEKCHLALSPLTKIHLWSEYPYDLSPQGNIGYVYLLGAIALLVLIIACINYINMATAHATKRAMEVGLRKTVGAARYQLFSQFMVEAFCLVVLSLLLGLAIAGGFLPYFNYLTDKSLLLPFAEPLFWLGISGIVLLVSFLSGGYPAVLLSRYQPVSIFQKTKSSRSGYSTRRGLVVFQFFISYVLIIGAFILKSQLSFLQSVNLGFDKENTIILPVEEKLGNQFAAFKNTLLNQPGISAVAAASAMFGKDDLVTRRMEKIEGMSEQEVAKLYSFQTDKEFLSLLKMQLIAGRFFSDSLTTDATEAVIINETAAHQLGWYANDSLTALGKYMQQSNSAPKRYVIGVVRDFHFESLKTEIEPSFFTLFAPETSKGQAEEVRYIPVKISGTDIPNTLQNIRKVWRQFMPDHPFEYSFLDEDFENLYRKEEKMATTFTYFSIIAIGLSFLGIIGLTTFVTLQRTKEIGIRKVLGASISSILLLLSKDHLRLIFIAFVVAIPIANYFITEWLKEFAYRIEVHWWMFALPGLFVLLITLLSITSQTWKAANTNPVDSLRNE